MLYQILPKKNYQFSYENTLMMFKSLANSSVHVKGFFKKWLSAAFPFCFIIECDRTGRIGFYMETDDISALNTLKVWSGSQAEVFQSDIHLFPYEVVDTLYLEEHKNRDKKRIASYTNEMIFLNLLGLMEKNTRITIDFKVVKAATSGNGGFRFASVKDVEMEALIRVYGKTRFDRNKVKNIALKAANLTAGDRQLYVDFRDSWKVSYFTGSEIANFIQLPSLYRQSEDFLKRIHYLRPGQTTLDSSEFNSGITIGRLYHPMQEERIIKVSEAELRKHSLITGTTGSGKTSVVEEMIDDLILRNLKGEKMVPGFTFFDPALSSVLGVLDRILKYKADGYDISKLMEKVIYIDFNQEDYIFPISLLNKNVEANELLDFLNSLYPDMNAIQVERMMNTAVSALMMDKEEHSIFDIERIFNDESFRENLIDTLTGNMYANKEISFLKGKFNNQTIAPILNRIDPFGNSRNKKLMFGMTSKYDMLKNLRKWMDEGYFVLMNIKGMNRFNTKTIVGYYLLQSYRTALQRPESSLLHMVIIDEDHKVQLPIVGKIAAETRKQGLAVVLMTQQMEQYDVDYLQKIIGNINTVVSLRQNDERAARNVKGFILSDIDIQDFKTLPDLTGYLSTTDSDDRKKSVLIKVRPPYRYTDGKLVDYENPSQVNQNIQKNERFAKTIMSRCMMPRTEAEQIVFHEYFNEKEKIDYERQLLTEGDSLLSVEEGAKVTWEETE